MVCEVGLLGRGGDWAGQVWLVSGGVQVSLTMGHLQDSFGFQVVLFWVISGFGSFRVGSGRRTLDLLGTVAWGGWGAGIYCESQTQHRPFPLSIARKMEYYLVPLYWILYSLNNMIYYAMTVVKKAHPDFIGCTTNAALVVHTIQE
ncbi:hypothetical protein FCM35_KLT15486 [Carex littledalei]|uniref:Uncharacterized protein n=1 Tax=Carex littledalei TaxID=544730 RepID=A0A833R7S4_9POAL|nr:hypothetical protein FCM35_KLT15486 [Carex littledalei]